MENFIFFYYQVLNITRQICVSDISSLTIFTTCWLHQKWLEAQNLLGTQKWLWPDARPKPDYKIYYNLEVV